MYVCAAYTKPTVEIYRLPDDYVIMQTGLILRFIVKCLLTEHHCDPAIMDGSTPLATTDLYTYYGKILLGGIPTHMKPAQSTVALFMVGDKGASKSTLTGL